MTIKLKLENLKLLKSLAVLVLNFQKKIQIITQLKKICLKQINYSWDSKDWWKLVEKSKITITDKFSSKIC